MPLIHCSRCNAKVDATIVASYLAPITEEEELINYGEAHVDAQADAQAEGLLADWEWGEAAVCLLLNSAVWSSRIGFLHRLWRMSTLSKRLYDAR